MDYGQNVKKMKLLTFMQLAEHTNELSFETIQKELNISENDVESFIIDGSITLKILYLVTTTAELL